MKVRLEPDLQLIITPESYVEQVALLAWLEKFSAKKTTVLVEAFEKAEEKSITLTCSCIDFEEQDPNCPLHSITIPQAP
jgi:hypothetical protein